ncbi:hypothetical protein ACB094_03G111500 [Castanea mollissima]
MREISCNVSFFIYFERYSGQHKQFCVLTKIWTVEGPNATKEAFSTIRSEGMKMCRDLKIQSQVNKNKAKYEMGHFCIQYGLPSVKPSNRKSKHRGKESSERSHRKKTATKYYRKQKYKIDDFYKKGKTKESIPQASSKCYNCGKKGHFKSECKAKAKFLINTLISDQPSKNEIFKLLSNLQLRPSQLGSDTKRG